MGNTPLPPLTESEIRSILDSGGAFALLEANQAGRIDTESAVTAIEEYEKKPLWERVWFAVLDTLFSS